jgi:hypothetical protein
MKIPSWQQLKLGQADIPAKCVGLWTQVCEYVEGPVQLKVKATGSWTYSEGRGCGPDGDTKLGFSQDVLLANVPRGALIAKVGGSTADKPDGTKQLVFAVGSECVITLEATNKGALFMTMNDDMSQFTGHDGKVTVEVWEWSVPPKPAANS